MVVHYLTWFFGLSLIPSVICIAGIFAVGIAVLLAKIYREIDPRQPGGVSIQFNGREVDPLSLSPSVLEELYDKVEGRSREHGV
jgi:dipeptide/tripeptide permease